ncbi:acyl dehydratase [Rhodoligotrophos appendicifer]|uniref:FAS1-like dehydratase domain-containing protein n=1 Tax=Rhodoligotrophos appendicifer TaxID=987056 RepID=UPI001186865D|nr:MaoC family dehydratase N-terminal domain-containing protein [Rhodoligotrophos appendicifer]
MNMQLLAPGLGPDALAEARKMIGEEFRIEQWNYEASRDSIRHYAWGLGDDNPLWSDPAYAAKTRWGGIIAPPTFCYGIFDAVVAPGLPDVQWIYSGTDWTFYRPIRRNEEISVKATLADAVEVAGGLVKRMIVQTGDVRYFAEDGELVAKGMSHCFRVPRATAEGGLRYKPLSEHRYTESELRTIEDMVLNEYRRGGDTLRFDDVNVGDVVPKIARGPINRLDMTCYYAGAVGTSGYKSTKLKWLFSHWARNAPEKLPNNYDKSYYGAAVSPSIGHQDADVATSEIGMPGPYDNGPQRIGMVASCITNWMGDDAALRTLGVRVKKPVIFGDTTFVSGKVTGKHRDGDRAFVDLEMKAENQRGEMTAIGTAAVELDAR